MACTGYYCCCSCWINGWRFNLDQRLANGEEVVKLVMVAGVVIRKMWEVVMAVVMVVG